MTQQHLSSADLLTLQILQRELTEPSISKDYERELRARIEYLNKDARPSREKVLVPAPRCYPLSMEGARASWVDINPIAKALANGKNEMRKYDNGL